jgi:mRNA interferase YafQ
MPRFHLYFTKAASKGFARMQKRGKDLSRFREVILRLQEGEKLDPRFRAHPLKGKYAGEYECHIEPDWLLVYHYEDDCLVLTDMGTHAELFDL